MIESTDNGIDFEMQELLNLENEKYVFKIFKKTTNTETKIVGYVYLETIVSTRKKFDKLNFNSDDYLIEKSKHIPYEMGVKIPYLGHLNMKSKFKGVN